MPYREIRTWQDPSIDQRIRDLYQPGYKPPSPGRYRKASPRRRPPADPAFIPPGGKHLVQTPSQRKAAAEAKIKAREAKLAEHRTPGPGSYSSRIDKLGNNSTLADMTGEATSWTMRSRVSKVTHDPYRVRCTDPHVGPGSHDSRVDHKGRNGTLADMTGENASSSFASTSEGINLKIERPGQADVPGPGRYTSRLDKVGNNATLADWSGEAESWAMRSKTQQRGIPGAAKPEEVPGPGRYHSRVDKKGNNAALADDTGESASWAFRMTEPRIVTDVYRVQCTPPNLGPGAYDSRVDSKGRNSELADMTGEYGSSAFDNTVPIGLSFHSGGAPGGSVNPAFQYGVPHAGMP